MRCRVLPAADVGWIQGCDLIKSPAFRLYADDFIAGTAILNTEETGAHILLMCHQWNVGGLPNDIKLLRRMARVNDDFDLSLVLSKYQKGTDGLLRNARLEYERAKQEGYRETQSNNGKAGANSRWRRHSDAINSPLAKGMAKDSFPFPSPFPSPSSVSGTVSASDSRKYFDQFWSAYPRKTARGAAERAWKAHKCGALITEILAAIKLQSESRDWKKDGGQFIPHPATWLNQHRWKDEVPNGAHQQTHPRGVEKLTGAQERKSNFGTVKRDKPLSQLLADKRKKNAGGERQSSLALATPPPPA